MKSQTYLLIFILLFTIHASAEVIRKQTINPDGTKAYVYYHEGKEVAKQILNQDGEIIKTIGKIPDGIGKEYYQNGALKAEGTFKAGKLEGIAKQYYQNGTLKAEWHFKNGKLDGISKLYDESGSIQCIYTYKNGQRIDKKEFAKEGNIKREKP